MHRGIHTGRFRAQGGTTTKWGGQILELDAEDFAERAWVAGSGWPFTKAELTRHYARALELEGVAGAMGRDDDVWRALGVAEPEFAGLESYLSRWCPEPNFARVHAQTLEGAGVRVWLHANAVGLVMEGEAVVGETVRGVRCKTQVAGAAEVVFRATEFVFCLGSIESVRFFMQPALCDAKGRLPWNASGLLGKNFQDHVDANVAEVRPRHAAKFSEMFDNIFLGGYKYHPKLRLAKAAQAREGVLNCGGTMAFDSDSAEAADALKATAKRLLRGRFGEVTAGNVAKMVVEAPLLLRQTLRYAVRHRAYNPRGGRVSLRVHCEQEPLGASEITLAGERDSLGMMRTRLDWRVSALELRTMQVYARTAAAALAGVADVVPDADLMAGDAAFLARCDDSNHHMGGMRMGTSGATSVVTEELRLRGTRNCFVCSGAVFPTSGFSNPTHTVIALAVRLAGMLGR